MSDSIEFKARDPETGEVFTVRAETAASPLPFVHAEYLSQVTVKNSANDFVSLNTDQRADVVSLVQNMMELDRAHYVLPGGLLLERYDYYQRLADRTDLSSDALSAETKGLLEELGMSVGITGLVELVGDTPTTPVEIANAVLNFATGLSLEGSRDEAKVLASAAAKLAVRAIDRDQLAQLDNLRIGIDPDFIDGDMSSIGGTGIEVSNFLRFALLTDEAMEFEAYTNGVSIQDYVPDGRVDLVGSLLLAAPHPGAKVVGGGITLAAQIDEGFQVLRGVDTIRELDAQLLALSNQIAHATYVDNADYYLSSRTHIQRSLSDQTVPQDDAGTIEVESSDPALTAKLPPLPPRKPPVDDPTTQDPPPEDPGTDPGTEPGDAGNPPAEPEPQTRVEGPRPGDRVMFSRDDEIVVYQFGRDVDGDGHSDSILEQRYGTQAYSTLLHQLQEGERRTEILDITVLTQDENDPRGSDKGAYYGPQVTDLLGTLTPELRSGAAQLALVSFADTAFENLIEAEFVTQLSSGVPDTVTFADALELAADGRIRYEHPTSPLGESFFDEFVGHGVTRLAAAGAAWLSDEFGDLLGLDEDTLVGQLAATFTDIAVLEGVHWAGNFLSNELGSAEPFSLSGYNNFWQNAGNVVTSVGVSYLLDRAFGDIGEDIETQNGAIALSVAQGAFAFSGAISTVTSLLSIPASFVPIVGPVLTFALGKLLTPVINRLFGHDDTIAIAILNINMEENRAQFVRAWEDDGGSIAYARSQAQNVVKLYQAVVEMGDAKITIYNSAHIGHTDDKNIGGYGSDPERWHFQNATKAIEFIASFMLSRSGLQMEDADYQRAYDAASGSRLATQLLEIFAALNQFNAIAEHIDALRAALALNPNDQDLADAVATYDRVLADELVQAIDMSERAAPGTETIYGGALADLLRGAVGQAERIKGNGGNDTIDGGGGQDSVFGGAGHDMIFAETGDYVQAGEGNDSIILLGSSAKIDGGTGRDVLVLPYLADDVDVLASDGTGVRIGLPDNTAFFVSRIEAIQFTDRVLDLQPNPAEKTQTNLADISIASEPFFVSFEYVGLPSEDRQGLFSIGTDSAPVLSASISDGDHVSVSFFNGREATGHVRVPELNDGLAHEVKLRIMPGDDTGVGWVAVFVDGEMVGSSTLRYSTTGTDQFLMDFTLDGLTQSTLNANWRAGTTDRVFVNRDGDVSNLAIETVGVDAPTAPIDIGNGGTLISGRLFARDLDGVAHPVFDGFETEFGLGRLRVIGDRYEFAPNDLRALADGEELTETIRMNAGQNEAVLRFVATGVDDPAVLIGDTDNILFYDQTTAVFDVDVEDPDDSDVSLLGISVAPRHGTATFEQGELTYQSLPGLTADVTSDQVTLEASDGSLHDVSITFVARASFERTLELTEAQASAGVLLDLPAYVIAQLQAADPGERTGAFGQLTFPTEGVALYSLTTDLSPGQEVQDSFAFDGVTLHFDSVGDPDAPPPPDTGPEPPPSDPDIVISGNQIRGDSEGRIDPELVPLEAADRSWITPVGTLTIEDTGLWFWEANRDGARALDTGESFTEARNLSPLTVSVNIAGLEDPARSGGVIYAGLWVDETSTFTGPITITDPDTSDRPTFAGAVADGRFGTATVSEDGASFTYLLNRLGPEAPEQNFHEQLVFTASDEQTRHTTQLWLAAREGTPADHWGPLQGTGADDLLQGYGGSDWVVPGRGNDTVDGGEGRDMVSFSGLEDVPERGGHFLLDLDLGAGIANIFGGELDTLASIERVTGTSYADVLRGSPGNDELRGLGDYDWFVATGGRDTLDGGNGLDMLTFVEAAGSGASGVHDIFAQDGAPPSEAAVSGVVVDLADASNNTGLAARLTLVSVERVTGSSHQDVFFGNGEQNDFRGLGGYDWFVSSTGGRERYFGGDGIDTVTYFNAGSGVTASLRNGAVEFGGQQTGYGSVGDALRDLYFEIENLVGSDFDDRLEGNRERNTLIGRDGDDYLLGYGDIDYLKGGLGNDTLDGGAGSDFALFNGNRADYTLTRTSSNEVTIVGPDGTDSMINVEYFRFDDQTASVWDLAIL